MKDQFRAGGKTYFVASNGSLKRVKGSAPKKRKRASLRAARDFRDIGLEWDKIMDKLKKDIQRLEKEARAIDDDTLDDVRRFIRSDLKSLG
jgi:hypothetical protein